MAALLIVYQIVSLEHSLPPFAGPCNSHASGLGRALNAVRHTALTNTRAVRQYAPLTPRSTVNEGLGNMWCCGGGPTPIDYANMRWVLTR